MICQACGVEAPTKYVSFHQNIGALVMRFSKSIEGNLCKSCIHSNFWSMTGTTAVLGWWGTISLIITPFLLLNNIGRYAFCLTMPAVPPGAAPPQLTDDVIQRIMPHLNALFERLNQGENLQQLCETTALNSGTSPGQVMLLVHAVIQQHQSQNQ
ncbi:hypothetical protein [Anatilimnocola floriformis]|uniref:hypothetical protein n=1 Tax=Anatilimnocola floriformis TaxID=2948575 RepID=UPI0020C24E25|nr:hypothetical protein [Anatilimnocola floriformis]